MIEVQKITNSEKDRDIVAKHNWYLRQWYGMIRSILVQYYQVHQILAIFGMLAWTTSVGKPYIISHQYTPDFITLAVVW